MVSITKAQTTFGPFIAICKSEPKALHISEEILRNYLK